MKLYSVKIVCQIIFKILITFRNSSNLDVSFCFQCTNVNEENCVTLIEYVEASVKLVTDTSYLMVTVISPSKTESLLMEDKIEQVRISIDISQTSVIHFLSALMHFLRDNNLIKSIMTAPKKSQIRKQDQKIQMSFISRFCQRNHFGFTMFITTL